MNDNSPDSARYIHLAAQAYSAASAMHDLRAQQIMLKIAHAYMRLARFSKEWEGGHQKAG